LKGDREGEGERDEKSSEMEKRVKREGGGSLGGL
jgi:hypothetical protein